MQYSIIEVEKTDGNKVDGTWAKGNRGREPDKKEPTTLKEAIEIAKWWENYYRNLREFAVVESVKKPSDPEIGPPLPYGKVFTSLVRLDKPRKLKVHKPIPFKGKFRCVFSDPPKEAGYYNIVTLRGGPGSTKMNGGCPINCDPIYHDGTSWYMEERNHVTESSYAYWVDYAPRTRNRPWPKKLD